MASKELEGLFSEVIGYESVKKELIRHCDVLKNFENYKKLGISKPNGLLVYGEPGLGKTLMCTTLCKATGLQYYIVRKSKGSDNLIDELNEAFEKASNNQPSIVYLDDMDKFSNTDSDYTNTEEFIAIQTLIDSVKDKDVFVVATANDILCFPESLLRSGRFDSGIRVSSPSLEDSVGIINHYLGDKGINLTSSQISDVAKMLKGYSCADLEKVVNDAGIACVFDGRNKVSFDDIVNACMRMLYDSPELTSPVVALNGSSSSAKSALRESKDIKNKKAYELRTAYHEAGHAIVSEFFDRGSVGLITIKRHYGDISGLIAKYTSYEKANMNVEEVSHGIAISLAGKAAIEVKFNETDTGCSSDVEHAYRIALFLCDNVASDGYGPYIAGQSYGGCSDKLNTQHDIAVEQRLKNAHWIAKQILEANKELMDKLVEVLLKKKYLTGSSLKRYIDKYMVTEDVLPVAYSETL